jgi:hypothetical protein
VKAREAYRDGTDSISAREGTNMSTFHRFCLLKYFWVTLLLLTFLPFPLFSDTVNAGDQKNPKQGNAMILVRDDNEKSLYDDLVLREQNFNFKIDVEFWYFQFIGSNSLK